MGRQRQRLTRILLNVGTVSSALMAVAAVVLWVRSYAHADAYTIQPAATRQFSIGVERGVVGVLSTVLTLPDGGTLRFEPPGWSTRPAAESLVDLGPGFLGFHADSFDLENVAFRYVAIPLWFLVLAFAAGPAVALRRRLHAWHRRPGTCPACGYDLRATPDRCPECGTAPPPAPPAG